LQPTRMMGRPLQKCTTSEIHWWARVSDYLIWGSLGHEGSYPYLLLDVVKGIRGVDSEADQDDVGIGVGERSETVVIFLASRIP
jgi:hypothetical protein